MQLDDVDVREFDAELRFLCRGRGIVFVKRFAWKNVDLPVGG